MRRSHATATLLGLAIVILGTAMPRGVANAQDPAPNDNFVALAEVTVELWPEYDRPAVLVIYRMQIAPGISMPTPLQVRIPALAGAPNAVAEKHADGRLVTLPYQRRLDGDWAWIQMNPDRPEVQIEYYDPRLERDGQHRTYRFTWPADMVVGVFDLSIQQPIGANAFTVLPTPAQQAAGNDGLVYHQLSLGSLQAGTTTDVTINYDKPTDALSIESITPALPAATDEPAAASTAPTGAEIPWPLVIGGVLAAIFVLAGLWLARRHTAAGPSAAEEAAAFCPQCGAPAAPNDRFCHACGHQLPGR